MPVLIPMLLALLALLAALPMTANAAAADAWPAADAQQLWQHPDWLRLLHMRRGWLGAKLQSQADDPAFFLSAQGRDDPRDELRATLTAFDAPAGFGDDHAQCRFVARLHWLRERLDLGPLPTPDCAAWRAFQQQVPATRAVLVFPSYYLNSPSSMFGHTLLRLDRDALDDGSEYLSNAANFGAVVGADDNGLFFALKGLTGGYPGQFAVEQYYTKIREYNRDENRDIWEFPLNLDAAETAHLVRHLWELRGIRFAYYFFDENCSFRLLELLEVARPGLDLTSAFPITAIPIDTIREVRRAGLIVGERFRASQGTALRQRLATLPPGWLPQLPGIADDPTRLNAPDIAALPAASRAAVTDAAYRSLRYRQTGEARDPAAAAASFALLRRLQAQAGDLPPLAPAIDAETAPDRSHGSRRVALGAYQEDGRRFATLGLRMSLHSLEENRPGFPLGAQINLGHFDFRIADDGAVGIQRIDFIDILSLSPRDAIFRPLSWSVLTGVERQWTDGRERTVAQVNGGAGGTWAIGATRRVYLLGSGRLEYNDGFGQPLQPALGLRSGLLAGLGRLTLHAELAAEQFANGEQRLRAELRQNLALGRNDALQFDLQWREQPPDAKLRLGLRYQHYF